VDPSIGQNDARSKSAGLFGYRVRRYKEASP